MRNNTILNKLNEESLSLERSPNEPVLNTNAYTIALYNTITNLIFNDIVNVGTTRTKVANIFCWESLDADGNVIQNTPATYSGKFGTLERGILKDSGMIYPTKKDYKAGEYFLFEEVVYQAIIDNPFASATGDDAEGVMIAIFDNAIRYVSEASNREGAVPPETSVRLRSWRGNVGSRRTTLEITSEASQDLGRVLNEDTEDKVIETIATVIAEDINKDVIHTLMNVSKRYKVVEGLTEKNYVDLSKSKEKQFVIGRELYAIVEDMIAQVTLETKHTPNYVITSPRIAGLINSSNMSNAVDKSSTSMKDKFILNDGTSMRVDVSAKFDYIIVGVNSLNASSLYLSNFVQDVKIIDDAKKVSSMELGTYTIVRALDTKTMSDRYLCLSRYALIAPPYNFSDTDDKDAGLLFGDRWEELAGKSPLSRFVGVKLPETFVNE